MGVLATGGDLDAVRRTLAHSPEAANDLTQLFQNVLGRAPGAAELAGMEDQLGTGNGNGASQQSLTAALQGAGTAGGYTTVTAPAGNATLTAAPGTPTLFVFGDIAFGQDTLAGFDPTRDTIQLPHTLAADFATINSETTASPTGTLITLNPTQSLTLANTSPNTLTAANFIFT
jgi:serralysin